MVVVIVIAAMPMRVFMFMVGVSMPVCVSAIAIRAAFGFKNLVHFGHREVHGAQHFRQYVIGFDFEVVGFQFNRHMAIAEMVCGTNQIKRAAMSAAKRNF